MKKYSDKIKLENNKKILVFSTDWCPDCIYLSNFIEEIVQENKHFEFIYINSDEYPRIAAGYQILGIPSFVALNEGQIIGTLISKDRKTKPMINDWLSNLN